ncbi:caprin-2-like [Haliotis rubra]|uniref:caprin-2-like n=1 Tax=Haliotis rubra TaxID=36100 RepID=UPI001EE581F3|nr:caprin-2-like [Haliotis rubra]
MFVAILLLCILLSDSISGLILPMTKPDGSTDLTSLLSHVTLLEQTVANLQKDVQANKAQAAEVVSLKTEVNLLSNELAVVKAELNDIKQGNGNSKIPTSAGLQITQRNLSQLTAELQSTKALAQNTSKQLEILKMDMNSTTAGLQGTQRNVSIISTEVTTLRGDLHVVQNQSLDNKQLLAMLASKTRTVAFQADVPVPSPTGVTETVTFNNTIYNAGSGYNSTTGRFTAPVSGTYMFWTQLELGGRNTNMYASIMASRLMLAEGKVTFTDHNIDDVDVSAVGVTHLNKGQEVWVEIYFSQHIYATSYFGGVLLSID